MSTAIAPKAVYLSEHPERTALDRLFEEHFEPYTRTYEQRFEHEYGFLRCVVPCGVRTDRPSWQLVGGTTNADSLRVWSIDGEDLDNSPFLEELAEVLFDPFASGPVSGKAVK